ncbi:MAG: methyltransferase [Chloroflexota bacterium]
MVAQIARTMVVLGIPDHLADGPCTVSELAQLTGTHSSSLARLVRALVSLDLCKYGQENRIELTPLGETLRSDTGDSLTSMVLLLTAPWFQRIWENLPEAIRTGGAVCSLAHGVSYWDYLAGHPDDAKTFDAGMTEGAVNRGQALLAARDLTRIGTLVDVGGGEGRLLAVLLTGIPGLCGHLVDRPDVVAGADKVLHSANVADRCTVTGADFFVSVPRGGDAYVLAQILHDWPDKEALAILRTCHQAMDTGTQLWIIERVLSQTDGGPGDALRDLNMLVLVGGQERTADEYRVLLEEAGFGDMVIHGTEVGWDVIEVFRK